MPYYNPEDLQQAYADFAQKHPGASPRTGTIQSAKDVFGQAFKGGVSLGYAQPDITPTSAQEHPVASLLGSLAGGIVPVAAATAIPGALGYGGLVSGLSQPFLGAGLGAARKADTREERIKNAVTEASIFSLFPIATAAGSAISSPVKALAAETSIIGGPSYVIERASGASPGEALLSSAIMAGAHGTAKGVKAYRKSRADRLREDVIGDKPNTDIVNKLEKYNEINKIKGMLRDLYKKDIKKSPIEEAITPTEEIVTQITPAEKTRGYKTLQEITQEVNNLRRATATKEYVKKAEEQISELRDVSGGVVNLKEIKTRAKQIENIGENITEFVDMAERIGDVSKNKVAINDLSYIKNKLNTMGKGSDISNDLLDIKSRIDNIVISKRTALDVAKGKDPELRDVQGGIDELRDVQGRIDELIREYNAKEPREEIISPSEEARPIEGEAERLRTRDVTEDRIVPEETEVYKESRAESAETATSTPVEELGRQTEFVFNQDIPSENSYKITFGADPEIVIENVRSNIKPTTFKTLPSDIKRSLSKAKINTINFGRKLGEYLSGSWKNLTTSMRNALLNAHKWMKTNGVYDAFKLRRDRPGFIAIGGEPKVKSTPESKAEAKVEADINKTKYQAEAAPKPAYLKNTTRKDFVGKAFENAKKISVDTAEAWNDSFREASRRLRKTQAGAEATQDIGRAHILGQELYHSSMYQWEKFKHENIPRTVVEEINPEWIRDYSWAAKNGKAYIESEGKMYVPKGISKKRVENLRLAFKDITESIAKKAEELGVKGFERIKGKGYFPHWITPQAKQALTHKSGELYSAIKNAVNVKIGIDSKGVMNDISAKVLEGKNGSIENPRIVNFPEYVTVNGEKIYILETNPYKVMNQYIERASRRLGWIEQFGQGEKAINKLSEYKRRIGEEAQAKGVSGDAEALFFNDVANTAQGIPIQRPIHSLPWDVLVATENLVRTGHLSMSPTTNATLGLIPAASRYGMRNTATSLVEVLSSKTTRGKMLEYGAYNRDAHAQAADFSDMQGVTRGIGNKIFRLIGLNYINAFVSSISSHAALKYFTQAAKKGNRTALNKLKSDFFFTEAEVEAIARRKGLNDVDTRRIAQRTPALTNVTGESALDSQPWMTKRIARQALAYTRPLNMLARTLASSITEAKLGNYAPLVAQLGGGLAASELNQFIRNWLKNKERGDDTFYERLMADMLYSGSLGLPGDFAQRALYAGKYNTNIAGELAGPVLSTIGDLYLSIANGYDLGKTIKRNVPLVQAVGGTIERINE